MLYIYSLQKLKAVVWNPGLTVLLAGKNIHPHINLQRVIAEAIEWYEWHSQELHPKVWSN